MLQCSRFDSSIAYGHKIMHFLRMWAGRVGKRQDSVVEHVMGNLSDWFNRALAKLNSLHSKFSCMCAMQRVSGRFLAGSLGPHAEPQQNGCPFHVLGIGIFSSQSSNLEIPGLCSIFMADTEGEHAPQRKHAISEALQACQMRFLPRSKYGLNV